MHDKLDEALARRKVERELPSFDRRRELRLRHGLSQQDIADALGVERTTVLRWETTTTTPRGDAISRYVAALQRLADKLGESL